jgi:uncharacterized membrane protein
MKINKRLFASVLWSLVIFGVNGFILGERYAKGEFKSNDYFLLLIGIFGLVVLHWYILRTIYEDCR